VSKKIGEFLDPECFLVENKLVKWNKQSLKTLAVRLTAIVF